MEGYSISCEIGKYGRLYQKTAPIRRADFLPTKWREPYRPVDKFDHGVFLQQNVKTPPPLTAGAEGENRVGFKLWVIIGTGRLVVAGWRDLFTFLDFSLCVVIYCSNRLCIRVPSLVLLKL